ncbi:BTB/POZ domain-containing protein At5g17580-like [Pistacia vera]|uniref:BTB/POZ domain-containing protein At5g17580-like n=1 Tax=Pistacia vera TaxID=55513 RepID=UPI001263AA66|nr:BTB/POZ domain-containing protein At5g17580-like [Pistacia vera]
MVIKAFILSIVSRLPKISSSSELQLNVPDVPLSLSRELLATKSAKVAAATPHENLWHFLREIPVDSEILEVVARFCHGFEVEMSTEIVIPLICVAYCLEMTETHAKNNLLSQAYNFFQSKVLPSWNETIKVCRVAENFLQQAIYLGLVDSCLESLIAKALVDPHLLLLGEPMIRNHASDDQICNNPNARRRLLFLNNGDFEDLTTLSLQLYEPLILSMNKQRVPSEYVAASICQYAKRWVFASTSNNISRNSQREIIEAVEGLLPLEKGLISCTLLFEMLRYAIALDASCDCRTGFEIRIGKQLEQATVKDLLIPSKGYAKEVQYEIECLKRILKNFYGSYCNSSSAGFMTVAELIEEFMAEVASDIDLKMETFISIANIATTTSSALGTERNLDGIYRGIDIYLEKHKYLTEIEREEICKVLDWEKMSVEACEHAAKNERLPLRVIVQVLFVTQLQLRDGRSKDEKMVIKEEVEEEIKKMSNKVIELERECFMMRKELSGKKRKISMWNEMKRKFGCIATTVDDCNCQDKDKHQRKKNKLHPGFRI